MPSRRFITLVFHLPPFSQTTTCSKALRYPRPPRTFPFPLLTRTYATHREIPHPPPPPPPHPDLLSNSSTSSRLGRTGAGPRIQDSVGPFPLGVGPSGRDKTWRPWSELGLGGKLVRTTRQTGNLTVILVGGALFVILTFALTTELFAPNSPSVLYSSAVDMIRSSDALNPHLLPPLKFTHSPASSAPTRGSPPIAHRFIKHPTSGRDHMIMTFWIHGRGKDEEETLGWVKGLWAGVEGYGREFGVWAGIVPASPDSDGSGFGAGNGVGVQGNGGQKLGLNEKGKEQGEGEGVVGRMFGGWTGLRSATGVKKESIRGMPPAGTYKIGEARAEYVKNADGQFTLLSLIVDIPSSTSAYPGRAVIYTSPEADTEGLLGKRIR